MVKEDLSKKVTCVQRPDSEAGTCPGRIWGEMYVQRPCGGAVLDHLKE